jgi:hypothetical protein
LAESIIPLLRDSMEGEVCFFENRHFPDICG